MPACSSSQLTCSLCCTKSRLCDELSALNTKRIAVGSGDGYQGEVTNHEWTRLRQGYGAAGTNRHEFSDGRLTTDYADGTDFGGGNADCERAFACVPHRFQILQELQVGPPPEQANTNCVPPLTQPNGSRAT